jgi:hypothetical protein
MPEDVFRIPELAVPITFQRRPISIPGDLRPHWQIGVVLLILWNSRKAKASLQKIHIMNWAVRDAERRAALSGYIDGEVGPEDVVVRYEPGLDRALRFAVAEGLVAVVKTNELQLTPKGSEIVQQIEAADCLQPEKHFLKEMGSRASEKRMKALLRLESLI